MTAINHFRQLELKTPFTLADLETFCATLRHHQLAGDYKISCNYQVELWVRIQEPVL